MLLQILSVSPALQASNTGPMSPNLHPTEQLLHFNWSTLTFMAHSLSSLDMVISTGLSLLMIIADSGLSLHLGRRVMHLVHLSSLRHLLRTSLVQRSKLLGMTREENTCPMSGRSSVREQEFTGSILSEMNLIRMELQREPTGYLQRKSPLYSMRHVCSLASGGMQWQHLCMLTTAVVKKGYWLLNSKYSSHLSQPVYLSRRVVFPVVRLCYGQL